MVPCPRQRLRDHTAGLLSRKWTLRIVIALSTGVKRRSELSRLLPGVTQKVLTETLREMEREDTGADKIIEFKETGHYVLPLTLTSMFEQYDPLSYVTGAMTKLRDDEQITLQLVATPTKLREADMLSHRILGNENILQQVSSRQIPLIGHFFSMTNSIAFGIVDAAGDVYMDAPARRREQSATINKQTRSTTHDRPSRVLSAFELELMETMHKKVTQPLFQVNLRILVKSPEAAAHISALKSALDGYSAPPYQALKAKVNIPVAGRLCHKAAIRRLPSLTRRSSTVLAASELASLYYFPSSQVSKTDNHITSLSRTLPAPVSLKQNKDFDVIIGKNEHHGDSTPIGLQAGLGSAPQAFRLSPVSRRASCKCPAITRSFPCHLRATGLPTKSLDYSTHCTRRLEFVLLLLCCAWPPPLLCVTACRHGVAWQRCHRWRFPLNTSIKRRNRIQG